VKSPGGEEEYFHTLVKKIMTTQTQIIFIGLGAPKQEYFMEQLKVSFDKAQDRQSSLREDSGQAKIKVEIPLILMAVGGAFEMISGRVKRAPEWMQTAGLEWLWRLIKEPWRWRRQIALVKFVWLVVKRRLNSSKLKVGGKRDITGGKD
jgi:N-acetylglucosaminyldiphosphoundecaprenol N-acetyl-beta-D-mannosaminyltransferase